MNEVDYLLYIIEHEYVVYIIYHKKKHMYISTYTLNRMICEEWEFQGPPQ